MRSFLSFLYTKGNSDFVVVSQLIVFKMLMTPLWCSKEMRVQLDLAQTLVEQNNLF
jgi:hypothetical protein